MKTPIWQKIGLLGLAWGVGGRLAAVRYPQSWSGIRDLTDQEADGVLLVLPYIGYLDPGFTHGRVVRQPAPAFFGDRAEVSDDVGVDGLSVPARTGQLQAALRSNEPAPRLARLGIRWVVVPRSDPWAVQPGSGFLRAGESGGLALLRTPSAADR